MSNGWPTTRAAIPVSCEQGRRCPERQAYPLSFRLRNRWWDRARLKIYSVIAFHIRCAPKNRTFSGSIATGHRRTRSRHPPDRIFVDVPIWKCYNVISTKPLDILAICPSNLKFCSLSGSSSLSFYAGTKRSRRALHFLVGWPNTTGMLS